MLIYLFGTIIPIFNCLIENSLVFGFHFVPYQNLNYLCLMSYFYLQNAF